MDHQSAIILAMRRPKFYPHPVSSVHLEQTHISLVFLTGKWVYKIKKPFDLGFLDFTTLEKRKHFCFREIELNRRLAHDVYQGVVPIFLQDNRYSLDGPGEIVEYAVQMRQLSAERTMSHLLPKGKLDASAIAGLARVLSEFYRNAASGPQIDAMGSTEVIRYNCEENFEQTYEFRDKYIDDRQHRIIYAATCSFLDHHPALFEQRIAGHKIRDCHGDLRTDHIYFCDDGLRIIDCIEFNKRFRYSDVAGDLAFLCMDLDFQGYPGIAGSLVAEYARHCGDLGVFGMLPFYKCYRAMVRTKVGCMRLQQEDPGQQEYQELLEQTRRYMDLAYQYAVEFSRPRIWVIFGMIASGKSTLAQALSVILGSKVLNSDIVRKDLFKATGKPFTSGQHAFSAGIYTEEATALTYGRLFLLAQEEIEQGRSVILDATFSLARYRNEARRLAGDMNAAIRFIECTCPEDRMLERLREREGQSTVSDARQELLGPFKARYQKPDEIPLHELNRVNTCRPVEENVIHVLSIKKSLPEIKITF